MSHLDLAFSSAPRPAKPKQNVARYFDYLAASILSICGCTILLVMGEGLILRSVGQFLVELRNYYLFRQPQGAFLQGPSGPKTTMVLIVIGSTIGLALATALFGTACAAVGRARRPWIIVLAAVVGLLVLLTGIWLATVGRPPHFANLSTPQRIETVVREIGWLFLATWMILLNRLAFAAPQVQALVKSGSDRWKSGALAATVSMIGMITSINVLGALVPLVILRVPRGDGFGARIVRAVIAGGLQFSQSNWTLGLLLFPLILGSAYAWRTRPGERYTFRKRCWHLVAVAVLSVTVVLAWVEILGYPVYLMRSPYSVK